MKKTLVPVTALVLSDGIHHVGAMQALTLPQDVEDFKHVGSLVIPDKASPLFGIHHFYLNDKGMAAFKKSGPYPGGHDLRRGALRGGRSRRGARGLPPTWSLARSTSPRPPAMCRE
jgi:hypothetical protein